ncbi:peptidoglycan-binding domain-containing protein [Sphingomonas immobilis]|uniref:Peptidoglycan-binding protein n=1 Tax=Sphingomonas immobilis TaxID=3063997 RepID=A0ABT9A403_9SPHN|nr:hypothetical protein [Sphingomonas sp. CA1-15]MDO7844575.1 hypothetical protein [Sphingomonas sp. CA1-15]
MPVISAPVGLRSPNRPGDVTVVQEFLNLRIATFNMPPLRVNGTCDDKTITAIRIFQTRCMGLWKADGRVDTTGKTLAALADVSLPNLTRNRNVASAAAYRLSGKDWFALNESKYPNSSRLADLTAGFQAKASAFVDALRLAQATVVISATQRNKTRAWLMNAAWRISTGEAKPGDITPPPDSSCDIIWDHGDDKESRKAAAEMVELFDIAYRPSLTSNHIKGTAVDMTITWSGPIEIKDAGGKTHKLDRPRNGAENSDLHKIGASYGVKKLLSDRPHWSADGH